MSFAIQPMYLLRAKKLSASVGHCADDLHYLLQERPTSGFYIETALLNSQVCAMVVSSCSVTSYGTCAGVEHMIHRTTDAGGKKCESVHCLVQPLS